METRQTRVDGHRVVYETRGSGDTIVFVHGWGVGRWMWREQLNALEDCGRLVALDLLGHGDSDKPEVDYSMALFARCIAAVLDDLGVGSTVLVGHSNGVPVIREFSRRYPRRTVGLIAIDGALRQVIPASVAAWMKAAVERPDFEEFMRQIAGRMPRGALSDADWERLVADAGRVPRHVAAAGITTMLDPATWSEDPIVVPLLVLCVNNLAMPGGGPLVSDAYRAFVRRVARDLRFEVLDGVTHHVPLEQPEKVNGKVREFVRRLVGS